MHKRIIPQNFFLLCIYKDVCIFLNFSLILLLKRTQDVQGSKLPQIQPSCCQISRCCISKTSESVETAEAVETSSGGRAAAVWATEAVETTKPVETRATASVMTFLAFFYISENLFLEILALKKNWVRITMILGTAYVVQWHSVKKSNQNKAPVH